MRALALVAAALVLAPAARAGSPALVRIVPRGAQRGREVELVLAGARLADAVDLVLETPGIALVSITPESGELVRARVAIAADAPIGLHGVRVRTRSGISELRTFAVGAFPDVMELEDNGAPERAQPIALDATVHGVALQEDADWYAFDGRAGERVSAELIGLRLGDGFFDPHLALIDARGFELAQSDDATLARQDPIVALELPADGRYFLRVRESSYRGGPAAHYLLSVGRFPRPLLAFPLGARAGEHARFALLGDVRGEWTAELALPSIARGAPLGWLARDCVAWTPESEGLAAPSPLAIHVSEHGGVLETEPNDAADGASRFVPPAALDGRIEQPGDRDEWIFAAKAGESYDVVVHARRSRSPLDARIVVLDAAGGVHAQNDDDAAHPDARLRFRVPADGDWRLAIDDHLGAGSALHAYRIEVAPPRPRLALQATRERQAIAVPAGARAALLLVVERVDFDGPLVLEASALPAGVRALAPSCPAGVGAIPLVLEAAPDAPLGHALADLVVRHADPAVAISASFRQDVELTYGRNQTLFCAQTVERVPVAVTETPPFTIELAPIAAPLVQDGSARLVVDVTRREGFTGAVTCTVPFLPPGVSAQQGVVVDGATSRVEIPIDANGGALLGAHRVCVVASGDAGQGAIECASALVDLEVAPPYVRFRGEATSVERGATATLAIAVEKLGGFTGSAQIELHGLPLATSAAPIALDTASERVAFAIQTTAESPLGRHQGLWCLARFSTERGEVVQRLPAAELRIDAPAAPVAASDAPPAPAAPAGAPAPVVETRLQKLRRETAERRAAREAAERASAASGGATRSVPLPAESTPPSEGGDA